MKVRKTTYTTWGTVASVITIEASIKRLAAKYNAEIKDGMFKIEIGGQKIVYENIK